MSNFSRERVIATALEAGFMLSTAHGQGADKLMPVTDVDTIMRLLALWIVDEKKPNKD